MRSSTSGSRIGGGNDAGAAAAERRKLNQTGEQNGQGSRSTGSRGKEAESEQEGGTSRLVIPASAAGQAGSAKARGDAAVLREIVASTGHASHHAPVARLVRRPGKIRSGSPARTVDVRPRLVASAFGRPVCAIRCAGGAFRVDGEILRATLGGAGLPFRLATHSGHAARAVANGLRRGWRQGRPAEDSQRECRESHDLGANIGPALLLEFHDAGDPGRHDAGFGQEADIFALLLRLVLHRVAAA